ncbi:MAG: sporulation initiation factor Spo0A C-terminal domain-containing protein [Clostridia bacterium]|nr:sporulation initiation factor Spo0A C-terminal domain-containing protein [Clostridia bacterium]
MKTIRILTEDYAIAEALSVAVKRQGNLRWLPHLSQGPAALELLSRDAPDILIVDLELSQVDGTDVISVAARIPYKRKPLFFALASRLSLPQIPHIRDEIAHCFIKPIDCNVLASQVWSLCALQSEQDVYTPTTPRALEKAASSSLIELGIPPYLIGFRFLREGIKTIAALTTPIKLSVCRHIYDYLGETYKTNASSIEHAMRHAIDCAWSRADINVLQDYFGNTYDPMRATPSNSQFMFMVADRIKNSRG